MVVFREPRSNFLHFLVDFDCCEVFNKLVVGVLGEGLVPDISKGGDVGWDSEETVFVGDFSVDGGFTFDFGRNGNRVDEFTFFGDVGSDFL